MRWKWILGTSAALILAVIVTVYIILSSYDFNKLKPTITGVVRDATGRELTLGGDIELNIGLFPRLVLENVAFQNAAWGSDSDLARIKRLEVQVALLPLLSGNVRIRRLVAIGPHILIETDKSGRSNLAFKPARETSETSGSQEQTHFPMVYFREICIEKGRLTYNDGPSGRSYEWELNTFTAKNNDKADGLNLMLSGTYGGMSFEMEGATGYMVAMADPQKVWPVKLSLKTGGALITLAGTIRDTFNGKGLDLDMTLECPSIPALAELAGVTGLPDVGPFKAAYKVTDPEGALTCPHLDIQLGAMDLAKLNVRGSIKHPLALEGMALDFELQGEDLANLEKLTGKPLPVKGPFSISGRARDASAGVYKLSDLKSSLGGSALEGSIAINLAGKRPSIDADLYSERLDVRPLLVKKNETKGPDKKPAGKGQKRKKVFPKDPLPIDALNKIDGHVKADVKVLLLPRSAFEDVNMDIGLEKGNLAIRPILAHMGGGRLNGEFRLCTARKIPTAALSLKVTKLDFDKMMAALQYGEMLEGKLDLEMDLKGQGRTPASIMASLDGKTTMVVGKARFGNSSIRTFGADISSSILGLLKPSGDQKEYTQINCFVSLFDIEDGIAVTSALVMDTPSMVVTGNGEINLKTEEIDLSLDPTPKKGVAGFSMSFAELAKPLKLGGTLAEPSLGVDPARATLALGKAVGGVVLFGPAGLLVALAGNSADDENPCLAAIEAAEKKRKSNEGKKSENKKGFVEKTMNSIGGTFKKLFANRTE